MAISEQRKIEPSSRAETTRRKQYAVARSGPWNLTANDIDRNLVYHGTAPYPLEELLAFDFPVDHGEANIRAVNYLDTPYTVPMTGKSALTVELSVTITGQPIYIYKTASNNTCNSPAKARLYFWSNGTRLGIEFGRWWSSPLAFQLDHSGVSTMRVPLTPDRWSSVYGKVGDFDANVVQRFQEALQT